MSRNNLSPIEKLFSLQTFGVKLGLENIIKFLEELHNPQNDLKCFHIAGSNGKGSTSSFIASILMEADFSTGLYTSPHFVKFNERIRLNQNEIDDAYIAEFVGRNEDFIFDNKLTFFEATTALAFSFFRDYNVDFAVIETGLGGRLDATNVISPLASIITSISLEHTNILGETIEQIANEKAGIIKSNSKLFLGKIPGVAKKIFSERCENINTEIYFLEDHIIEYEKSLKLYAEELNIDELESPLHGFYQRYNAALAGLTVYKTLDISDTKPIVHGIHNVVQNSGISGRYEIVSENPKVILDSAHNPEGVKNFLDEFRKERNNYSECILIYSALKDKNIEEIASLLSNSFSKIFVVQLNNERAADVNTIQEIFSKEFKEVSILSNVGEYITDFIMSDDNIDKCLTVLGSMYLIGEVKQSLRKDNS